MKKRKLSKQAHDWWGVLLEWYSYSWFCPLPNSFKTCNILLFGVLHCEDWAFLTFDLDELLNAHIKKLPPIIQFRGHLTAAIYFEPHFIFAPKCWLTFNTCIVFSFTLSRWFFIYDSFQVSINNSMYFQASSKTWLSKEKYQKKLEIIQKFYWLRD